MMGEISEKVSIEAVLKAIGVQFVEICSPFDLAKAQEAVKRAAEHKGVAARHLPCSLHYRIQALGPF